ncbi:NAD-dependent epimerase/dehydratase family protein [Frateuria aurantia]
MESGATLLVTGITGYIGGTVAVYLREQGYRVLGLARRHEDIQALQARGFEAVQGSLQDVEVLRRALALCDGVVHTADSDDPAVIETFASLLRGTGKTFIYTSGSAIVANWDRPASADFVYTEDYPVAPVGPMGHRVGLHHQVLRLATEGVRSVIIVPSLVYGEGRLLNRESKQLPWLIRDAGRRGHAVYVGSGEHCWSHVHVDDLAELYRLVLQRARAGTCFFAEQGLISFKVLAEAIHRRLGYAGQPVSIRQDEAIADWGELMAKVALGSDCRLSADKARGVLGWSPRHDSPLPFI